MKKRAIITLDKFCTTGQVIPCVGFNSSCPKSTSTDGKNRNMLPSKVFNLPLLNESLAEKFAHTPQNYIPLAKTAYGTLAIFKYLIIEPFKPPLIQNFWQEIVLFH